MTITTTEAVRRAVAIAMLNAVAVTHLADLSHKLEEGIVYMAVLFSLLIVASISLAILLLRRDRRGLRATWLGVAALGATALTGYVVSRVVALPQMADHVGDWAGAAGIASVLAELLLIAVAGLSVRRGAAARRLRAPVPRLAAVALAVALAGSAGGAGIDDARAHGARAAAPATASAAPARAGDHGDAHAQAAPAVAATSTRGAPSRVVAPGGPAIPFAVTLAAIVLAAAFSAAAAVSLARRVDPLAAA